MKTKVCTKCGVEKPLSEFCKNNSTKDKFHYSCKECMKKYGKKYRNEHKKELKQKSQEYYLIHKKEMKIYSIQWRKKNPNKVKSHQLKSYNKKKDNFEFKLKNRKNSKNWQLKNKERVKQGRKQRRLKNIKYYREIERKRMNKFLKTNFNYKLAQRLRHQIYLRIINHIKSDNTRNLLGCSIEDFKKHLQAQFKEGMNWANYGKNGWEIDHIKPCTKFDLTKESEQRKCFHYSNLQPLWASENRQKGAK